MGNLILPDNRLMRPTSFLPNIKPTGAVELNPNHWLTSDIVSAPYVDDCGQIVDLTGRELTPQSPVGATTDFTIVGSRGSARKTHTGSYQVYDMAPIVLDPASTGFTITTIFNTSSVANYAEQIAWSNSGNSGSRIGVGKLPASVIYLQHLASYTATFTISYPLNEWVAAIATMNTAGHIIVYCKVANQIQRDAPAATVSNGSAFTLDEIYIGASPSNPTSRSVNGLIESGLLINRVLSDDEAFSWLHNPYQYLQVK